MKQFTNLGLAKSLFDAIKSEGYKVPTPIQSSIVPKILNSSDVIGIAQTGTGKTAAYVLPLLDNIIKTKEDYFDRCCKSLILVPTRELAMQVINNIKKYGRNNKIKVVLIVGGAKPGPQIRNMDKGVDIIVATPGRLLDHMFSSKIKLHKTHSFVLDEADQMLDLGFMPSIRKIISKLPKQKQAILMSATMPEVVKKLTTEFMKNPIVVNLSPKSKPVDLIEQKIIFIRKENKIDFLTKLLNDIEFYQALIFTKTKRGADKLSNTLKYHHIVCQSIHGDKRQGQRSKILSDFRKGNLQILIATDLAARGIDIKDLSHVINFDMPIQAETYVHRIGRTARAGKNGIAISLCDKSELKKLKDIEKLIDHTFDLDIADEDYKPRDIVKNKVSKVSNTRRIKEKKHSFENKKISYDIKNKTILTSKRFKKNTSHNSSKKNLYDTENTYKPASKRFKKNTSHNKYNSKSNLTNNNLVDLNKNKKKSKKKKSNSKRTDKLNLL